MARPEDTERLGAVSLGPAGPSTARLGNEADLFGEGESPRTN